jgi:hypothetical protein
MHLARVLPPAAHSGQLDIGTNYITTAHRSLLTIYRPFESIDASVITQLAHLQHHATGLPAPKQLHTLIRCVTMLAYKSNPLVLSNLLPTFALARDSSSTNVLCSRHSYSSTLHILSPRHSTSNHPC